MKYWLCVSLLLTTCMYADDSDSSDSELKDFQPGQTRRRLQEKTGLPVINQEIYNKNICIALLLAQDMCLGERFVRQVEKELAQQN